MTLKRDAHFGARGSISRPREIVLGRAAGEQLTRGELDQIVAALAKRGAIAVKDGKVSYTLG